MLAQTEKYKSRVLFAVFAFISSGASLADERAMMRLLQPTFKFQICVREEAQLKIERLHQSIKKDWEIAEGQIWNAVLKDCAKFLDDDFKDRLYVTYRGDSSQAKAYIDGVIWSGRAYVTSKVIEHQQSLEQK